MPRKPTTYDAFISYAHAWANEIGFRCVIEEAHRRELHGLRHERGELWAQQPERDSE